MEKLSFENIKIDNKETINKIKSDLSDLLLSLNVTDKELEENFNLFLNYYNDFNICKGCNTNTCLKKSLKGYRQIIKRDLTNHLTDGISVCNKYKEYYKMLDNVIYSTFNNKDLLDNKNLAFLKNNISLLDANSKKDLINLLSNKPIKGSYLYIADSKSRKIIVLAIAYSLLNKYKLSVVNFPSLINEIKGAYNTLDEELLNKLKTSSILIIDDLGNETINMFSRDSVLLPLLDYRLSNDLTTIITSSYKLADLANLYKLNYNDQLKAKLIVDKIKEFLEESYEN